VRLLQNLKASHLARGDLRSALVVAARTKSLLPSEPWPLRDLGVLHAKLGAPRAARAELHAYLELAPSANDAAAIRAVLARLQTTASAPN
jgi:regulator of sirC expression with transglutaminase-like and TPR domain